MLFGDNLVVGSSAGKSTSAAIFDRCRDTSNKVTGRKAFRPARKPSAFFCQPMPSAVTIPAPVTTTRFAPVGSEFFGAGKSTLQLCLRHFGNFSDGGFVRPFAEIKIRQTGLRRREPFG
jgi:hypothetical protein